jgi:predicted RNase H-like HicB family nuclease
MKTADLTLLIQKDNESGMYVGQIEEFPVALSQGKTIEELNSNIIDALKLLLDVQKELLHKSYGEVKILKEKFQFAILCMSPV